MPALTRSALITAICAAALSAAGIATSSVAAVEDAGPDARRVRVAEVTAAPSARLARLHGHTRARARGVAAFTAPGRLVERAVHVGDRVAQGQALARLDPLPLAHAVSAARAQVDDLTARLDQARADRDRLRGLDASGAVAPAERERLESQERSLHAALAQARVGLDEALRQEREGALRAPYAGEIAAVFAEPGETVAAGAPIVALAGAGLEVVIEAPEAVWALVVVDLPAQVTLPGQGCAVPGARVDRVASAAAGPAGLFEVQIALPELPGCRVAPGISAEVDLPLPVPAALSVPVRAVLDPTGGGAAVLRLRDGSVERVAVTPLALDGDRASVSGDLAVGDQVVVAGLLGLVPGDRVEVVR